MTVPKCYPMFRDELAPGREFLLKHADAACVLFHKDAIFSGKPRKALEEASKQLARPERLFGVFDSNRYEPKTNDGRIKVKAHSEGPGGPAI